MLKGTKFSELIFHVLALHIKTLLKYANTTFREHAFIAYKNIYLYMAWLHASFHCAWLLDFQCPHFPVILKFQCLHFTVILKFQCLHFSVILKFQCLHSPVIVKFQCLHSPVIVKVWCLPGNFPKVAFWYQWSQNIFFFSEKVIIHNIHFYICIKVMFYIFVHCTGMYRKTSSLLILRASHILNIILGMHIFVVTWSSSIWKFHILTAFSLSFLMI